MKKTEQDWTLWDKVVGDLQLTIKSLETQLTVNKEFLERARDVRNSCPKPKDEKYTNSTGNTGNS